MSEVKRYRADHRHVVETEFDDAQYVGVSDYDAAKAEIKALREELAELEDEFDTLEHGNISLKMALQGAEQLNAEYAAHIRNVTGFVESLASSAGSQPSIATGYLRDILDAIKATGSGEGK